MDSIFNPNKQMKYFQLLLFGILLYSCNESSSYSKDVQDIMKLHHAQRNYHFNKDSISFANQMSDSFIAVNRGEIKFSKRQELIKRYHGYFSSVKFIKWDDQTEPILKFSIDRSLAYTIVDKIVVIELTDSLGNKIQDSTRFAWTTLYKKYESGWKIDVVTSTNR